MCRVSKDSCTTLASERLEGVPRKDLQDVAWDLPGKSWGTQFGRMVASPRKIIEDASTAG